MGLRTHDIRVRREEHCCKLFHENDAHLEARRLGEQGPTGGRLNEALARSVVRIQREYMGRGPTRARAFFRQNMVVVLLEDVFTTGERSLVADGDVDAVLELRKRFQRAMQADLTEAVEVLTGGKVVAVMADAHVDPDMAAMFFALDRPVPNGAQGS